MKRGILLCIAIAAGAMLLGQGCTGSSSTTAKGPDGGVWKTTTRGTSWTQKRVLIKGAKAVSLGNDVMTTMVFDPEDSKTLYAGTTERGLVYSLDSGDSWQEAGGPKGQIESVAVDPKNKCAVYVATVNKIFKTENCMRDWKMIFFDPKTDKVFTRIKVDWYNPTIVYAGTSEGDIFKSTDAGLSWLVAKRVGSSITAFLLDSKDSRALYVGTKGNGIWKTMDGGETWIQIWDALSKYTNAGNVLGLVADAQSENVIYLVSGYGILSSADGGATWNPLTLTSKPGAVAIKDFTVNPRNGKELSYITSNALITSTDGGQAWTSQKLPSTRIAKFLLVDPNVDNTFYLGIGAAPQSQQGF
jgi:photosystem II stability/assembly factor-like uncharacterized protein